MKLNLKVKSKVSQEEIEREKKGKKKGYIFMSSVALPSDQLSFMLDTHWYGVSLQIKVRRPSKIKDEKISLNVSDI